MNDSEAQVRGKLELVAHRGFASQYPENTFLALERAVDAGARHLEFDIHLTRDRVPVLLHDEGLERTADRNELIAEIDSSELSSYSVHEPARFGDRFSGEPIPRLSDVVAWLGGLPSVHSFVEMKRKALSRWSIDAMVPAVVDALEPIQDRTTVISFDAPSVAHARSVGARSIGWVLEAWNADALDLARELKPEFLFVNYKKIPAGLKLWPGSWRWVVYEVVDPAHALALVARGADLIETMQVGPMIRAMEASSAQASKPHVPNGRGELE